MKDVQNKENIENINNNIVKLAPLPIARDNLP